MPIVPLPIAKACMEAYTTLMRGEDLQRMHQAFTNTVTFDTKDFGDWLLDNKYLENSDSIRICFGIYTSEAAKQLGGEAEPGRVTAFVCPIKNNEEVDAYNLGQTGP